MEDMRPGFGPVLGPPKPRHLMSEREREEDDIWADYRRHGEVLEGMKGVLRSAKSKAGLLALLTALIFCPKAHADEPYLEVSALRIQSYVKVFAGVTERLVEQRGLWGGEVIARVPIKDLIVCGRPGESSLKQAR